MATRENSIQMADILLIGSFLNPGRLMWTRVVLLTEQSSPLPVRFPRNNTYQSTRRKPQTHTQDHIWKWVITIFFKSEFTAGDYFNYAEHLTRNTQHNRQPCKHAVTCQNWAGSGPMLPASALNRPSSGMFTGNRLAKPSITHNSIIYKTSKNIFS